jgi:hypothetical protein
MLTVKRGNLARIKLLVDDASPPGFADLVNSSTHGAINCSAISNNNFAFFVHNIWPGERQGTNGISVEPGRGAFAISFAEGLPLNVSLSGDIVTVDYQTGDTVGEVWDAINASGIIKANPPLEAAAAAAVLDATDEGDSNVWVEGVDGTTGIWLSRNGYSMSLVGGTDGTVTMEGGERAHVVSESEFATSPTTPIGGHEVWLWPNHTDVAGDTHIVVPAEGVDPALTSRADRFFEIVDAIDANVVQWRGTNVEDPDTEGRPHVQVAAFSSGATPLFPTVAGRTLGVRADGSVEVGLIQNDKITAASIATDAVTEIQSGIPASVVAAILAQALRSGSTVKGLLRGLDALFFGEITGAPTPASPTGTMTMKGADGTVEMTGAYDMVNGTRAECDRSGAES